VGTPVGEVCRKMGISDATLYNLRKKYGGLGTSELCRLNQPDEKTEHLKRLVVDLSLKEAMLQDVRRSARPMAQQMARCRCRALPEQPLRAVLRAGQTAMDAENFD
jgi:putative transposase